MKAKIKFALVVICIPLILAACSKESEGQTVTFPASDSGKTEQNAAVYEITPFDVSAAFPEGWTLTEREPSGEFNPELALSGVWSVLDIWNGDGERIGAMGYNIYEEYEDAKDVPQAIYGQIALGNDYRFDVRDSYRIVKSAGYGDTAVCDVYSRFS